MVRQLDRSWVVREYAPERGHLVPGTAAWQSQDSLPFVGDAGYGDVSELRGELNARGRPYILEVMLTTAVWPPGTEPEAPEGRRGKRGPARTVYHDGEYSPVSVAELVLSQTRDALTDITWRNGDGPQRRGQFGAMRVQPASGHKKGMAPEPEQWLLWEWQQGAELPSHYWLSTLPADMPLERLVYLAELRWRVRSMVRALIASQRVAPQLHRVLTEELPYSQRKNVECIDHPLLQAIVSSMFASAPDPDIAFFIARSAIHAVVHDAACLRPVLLSSSAFVREVEHLARSLVHKT